MKKFKQINGQLNETSKSIARAVDKIKADELEDNKKKEKSAVCICKAKT